MKRRVGKLLAGTCAATMALSMAACAPTSGTSSSSSSPESAGNPTASESSGISGSQDAPEGTGSLSEFLTTFADESGLATFPADMAALLRNFVPDRNVVEAVYGPPEMLNPGAQVDPDYDPSGNIPEDVYGPPPAETDGDKAPDAE